MTTITIIGAGLSGLSLATHLINDGVEGKEIQLFHSHQHPTASQLPCALLNPTPGPSVAPKPFTLEAFSYSLDWFQKQSSADSILEIELWRPFSHSNSYGERIQRSFENNRDLLEKHVQASKQKIFLETTDWLHNTDEIITFPSCLSIALHQLCQRLKQYLVKQGVTIIETPVTSIKAKGNGWRMETGRGPQQSDKLVLCTGSAISKLMPNLPFCNIAGHVLEIDWKSPLPKKVGLSGNGVHMVPTPWNTWILGSTYYHHPEQEPGSEDEIANILLEKAAHWIAQIKESNPLKLWRGSRLTAPPDRSPVVGPVPEMRNLFILSAFASKGTLWIPWTAKKLSKLLTRHDNQIPKSLSVSRLKTPTP
ncbi:MAG: FAD-dependent oxidoreductase [Myxococcota bacterium]|nr:FAD-dependent oxidoreductase [Myxococcota bacterium]